VSEGLRTKISSSDADDDSDVSSHASIWSSKGVRNLSSKMGDDPSASRATGSGRTGATGSHSAGATGGDSTKATSTAKPIAKPMTRDEDTTLRYLQTIEDELRKVAPVQAEDAIDLEMMHTICRRLKLQLSNFQEYFNVLEPSESLNYYDHYSTLRGRLEDTIRGNKIVQSILERNVAAPQLPTDQHTTAGSVESIEVSRGLVKEVKTNPLSDDLDVHSLNSLQKTVQPLLEKKVNKLTSNREKFSQWLRSEKRSDRGH
jgi:hypothetical protein